MSRGFGVDPRREGSPASTHSEGEKGVDPVIETINASNQRAGRMLLIVDLIEAGTLRPWQAAYLVDRVAAGASFLVGASPGGAGKTTVMGALLAFAEPTGTICVTSGTRWRGAQAGDWAVCYEISPGAYRAYLWGEELRAFLALGQRGVHLATNLHADTVEEAREQIVEENAAGAEAFGVFELFVPIRIGRTIPGPSRIVDRVFVQDDGTWRELGDEACEAAGEPETREFLAECREAGIDRIEEVRARWLARRAGG